MVGRVLILRPGFTLFTHLLCIFGLVLLQSEFILILRHLIELQKLEIQSRKLKADCWRFLWLERTQQHSGFSALVKYVNDTMTLCTGASVSHLWKCCYLVSNAFWSNNFGSRMRDGNYEICGMRPHLAQRARTKSALPVLRLFVRCRLNLLERFKSV